MRGRALPVALAVGLAAAGCTGSTAESGTSEPESAALVETSAPESPLTVLPDEDAVALSLGISAALFDRAPVVVTAQDDDGDGMLLAASAAVELGVPLLVEGSDGALDDELERLGTGTVLAVGEADGADGVDVVRVPATPEEVDEAAGRVPPVRPGEDRSDTVVLVGDADSTVGAVATARAAGARVVELEGTTDPRASEAARSALADDSTEAVVALGADLDAEDGLDWKVATAASGTELPGGGQLLFPGRMMVALYGHQGTGALGVLGEQPVDAAVQRARDTAAPYEALVDTPVVPAFEIIVTVASEFAGPDGNYSTESTVEDVRPWVEAAGAAGLYVVLDLQPGRTDFVTQAELYRPLLELPYVGLALDPEWRLGPGEVHLTQIGSVGIEEVNGVVTWLADLTREKSLPQKLLVLHQFRIDMLPGLERLDTARDELGIMIHADGQGPQASKQATWQALHGNAPPGLSWGWKNFYDEDVPMLTPQQTIEQVVPRPELVTYQ